jgi:AbrB family looped-hinge helix DNA binding protein
MKMTQKGQVTVPKEMRDAFGMGRDSEVSFRVVKEGILLYPEAKGRREQMDSVLQEVRGIADGGIATDAVMEWTRE